MSFFSVTKLAPTLVAPSEPTPSGNLPLSFMDQLPASRFLVDSIHVFGHGQEPGMVIKAALSKALVPYYPVAGRLAMSDQGELEVACTRDGVWFVEASVDRSLKDLNHLELPLAVPKEELLPYLSPEVEKDLIVMMQVTQFSCGGFVVGMRSSHAMFDGLGAAQFVRAIADIAKGLAQPMIRPIWCREAIPSPPPKLPSLRPPPPSLTAHPFVTFLLDISLDRINETKSKFTKETGKYCSKFDILTAKVWQSRARAIGLKPGADVRLGFAANARHLMHQLLPPKGGYYGNCAYPMTITAPSEKITDSSLFEVINLIREAKESLGSRFAKWLVGDPEGDPFRVPVDYGLLCFSDWSRVGFYEVDYGWGQPIHVGPLDDNSFIASCILLNPPAPKQGVRLITRCVVEEQLGAFQDQMANLV
ncbi:myricetin 3-O-glucosyl 1,2-rhamnoside 6'-O-caffeoyltransferase AT2-like [Phoenix dactylifera]|uniref:Myricetin 3-O-glucosyl 1,2-rhamnoside 6'-O-caffeoyltransferase AT2-like n=1 Tax=Phoenix dactylifera TaxID=42345 RepID=A0A8B7BIY7_PHODC|nr:myricetin 3-O-glucosyl 1,2-rhamnoside 6'-O-caffeoyltransferase AT2-like [Phoenix dactylifera]